MPVIDIIWDLPDDPEGNVQHIAQHGLVPSEVEYVLNSLSCVRRAVPAGGRWCSAGHLRVKISS